MKRLLNAASVLMILVLSLCLSEASAQVYNEFYSPGVHGAWEEFNLGNFELENGAVLADCKQAYVTFGKLNPQKDNAIVFTIMFSGSHMYMAPLVGPGKAIDTDKYFVIMPDLLGNGISTAPSNTAGPYSMGAFPHLTIGDMVRAQHQLVTEKFGITEIQMVTGWSMGGQQVFEWAVRYPDMVKRAAPIGASLKACPWNKILTDLVMNTLRNDPNFNNGFYTEPHACQAGLRNLGRLFSLIAASKEMYQGEHWRRMGFTSLEDFERRIWEGHFLPMDPNNLITMAWAWQHADASLNTEGDLVKAQKAIKAKMWPIVFTEDMMFDESDIVEQCVHIKDCKICRVPSHWGHFATLGLFPEDAVAIEKIWSELLSTK
jgi:homoserine O-acetyltransferase